MLQTDAHQLPVFTSLLSLFSVLVKHILPNMALAGRTIKIYKRPHLNRPLPAPPLPTCPGPSTWRGLSEFPRRPRLSTRFEVMFLCNLWCSSAQLTGPQPGLTSAHPARPTPRLTGPRAVPTPACPVCRARPTLPLLVLASAAQDPAHPPSSAPTS